MAVAIALSPFAAIPAGPFLFVGFGALSATNPKVLPLALGERALPRLGRAGTWLDRNSGALVAGVVLIIGLGLLASGVKTVAG